MNCYDVIVKNEKQLNHIVNKTAFKVLATLLERATTGHLLTAPGIIFSKNELDYTDSKGKTIAMFIENPDHFPVKTSYEMIDFLDFVLSKLTQGGVHTPRELQNIYNCLNPIDFDLPDMLFFIKMILPCEQNFKGKNDRYREKIRLLRAENLRLQAKISSLENQLKSVVTTQNEEKEQLAKYYERKPEIICGVAIGKSSKKVRLSSGKIKTYFIWYAYDKGKKIYLGTTYDKAKFEAILKSKGYPKRTK